MDSLARQKLESLVADMGSQAQVARALEVSPSRVSRWLKDEEPDRDNLIKLEAVEFALSRLQATYRRPTALKWLYGFNAHVGGARPIDLLNRGRVSDVLRAIEADETGAYAQAVLYRVYRALEGVAPSARGGPLFVPREYQGAGRHDSPGRYGAFYAARTPVAAVAETIQAFRGRDLSPEDLERSDGTRLMLAVFDDSGLETLLDLDEPAVLVDEGWRPSGVASRDRSVTQGMAVRAFEAGALGLSWWSTLDSAWTNVTLFADRALAGGAVTFAAPPEPLTSKHPDVIAAADHLAIPLIRRRHRRGR